MKLKEESKRKEELIGHIVYHVYGLTQEEVEVIEKSLAPQLNESVLNSHLE